MEEQQQQQQRRQQRKSEARRRSIGGRSTAVYIYILYVYYNRRRLYQSITPNRRVVEFWEGVQLGSPESEALCCKRKSKEGKMGISKIGLVMTSLLAG